MKHYTWDKERLHESDIAGGGLGDGPSHNPISVRKAKKIKKKTTGI